LQFHELGALGYVATPGPLALDLVGVRAPGGLLDPACGDGALLLAAWEASGHDPGLAERLHGIELDPERARRTRRLLREAIGGEAGRRAARRVVCADALLAERWPRGTAVAANPPWVSLTGRQRGAVDPERERAYREAYPEIARWPSLHGAFLARIARHVAAERAAARVLVPETTCHGARYAPLRAEVERGCGVRWIRRAVQGEFPGVVETAALLELGPEPGPARWAPASTASDDRLAAHLAGFPRLPARCFGDVGVHTGNRARALVRRGVEPSSLGAGSAPLREGRDLRAFALGPPTAALAVDAVREPGASFRIPPLERHVAVPILVRQTAARPIAARHTAPTYFRNSLLACTPPPGLAVEVVLAVLNSEVAAALHRASFADARQAAFPQVKVRHLRALPFPWLDRSESAREHDEIVDLVRAIELEGGSASRGSLEALERLVLRAFRLA